MVKDHRAQGRGAGDNILRHMGWSQNKLTAKGRKGCTEANEEKTSLRRAEAMELGEELRYRAASKDKGARRMRGARGRRRGVPGGY